MLTALMLFIATATPPKASAPDSPGAILVLTSGSAMPIKSYIVKEPLLHVESREGQKLTVKVSDVDVDASIAATKQWLAEREAKLAAKRTAEEQAAADAERAARRKAYAASRPARVPGMTVLSSTDSAAADSAARTAQRRSERSTSSGSSAKSGSRKSQKTELDSRISDLESRIASANESLGHMKRSAWAVGLHTIEGQMVIEDMESLRKKHVTPNERELAAAKKQRAALK